MSRYTDYAIPVLNINEYQEHFLGVKGDQCVGLTSLPPSYVDCLEVLEPQPPGTLRACRACTGIALPDLCRTQVVKHTDRDNTPLSAADGLG